jgi:hypothetical protein
MPTSHNSLRRSISGVAWLLSAVYLTIATATDAVAEPINYAGSMPRNGSTVGSVSSAGTHNDPLTGPYWTVSGVAAQIDGGDGLVDHPRSSSAPKYGFTDYYAPANWIDGNNGHGGLLDLTGIPSRIAIYGTDDWSGEWGSVDFFIQVPRSGTFSFDWSWQSFDVDVDGYDFSYYNINNDYVFLSGTGGTSGSISVPVSAGDVIGWRVEATDSRWGPGLLVISNFSAPVPEPAALLLTSVATGLSVLVVRWRRRSVRVM